MEEKRMPFIPANSTEGQYFMEKNCEQCTKMGTCKILDKAFFTSDPIVQWSCSSLTNPNTWDCSDLDKKDKQIKNVNV